VHTSEAELRPTRVQRGNVVLGHALLPGRPLLEWWRGTWCWDTRCGTTRRELSL